MCGIVNNNNGISIHAPREGCDGAGRGAMLNKGVFQSTHPVRGATFAFYDPRVYGIFQSTHPVRGAT